MAYLKGRVSWRGLSGFTREEFDDEEDRVGSESPQALESTSLPRADEYPSSSVDGFMSWRVFGVWSMTIALVKKNKRWRADR